MTPRNSSVLPTNKYTQMQIDFYNGAASEWSITNPDAVVGSFHAHNMWPDYVKLFTKLPESNNLIGLDFACGPGRNLVKYANRFHRLDGVDLSPVNIEKAKEYTTANNLSSVLYVSNGIEMPEVPSATYDFVMSTIALQHIAVYDIRFAILKEIYRVLKSGGIFSAQMGYGSPCPATVDYYANHYDAEGTNSVCDVCIESPEQLKTDLLNIGFTDFEHTITQTGPGDRHPNWIFFSVRK